MSIHLRRITMSTDWLGSCHMRPGCQGNCPLTPPVLIRFLLLSAPCSLLLSLSWSHFGFFSLLRARACKLLVRCVFVCLRARNYQWVCMILKFGVSVTGCFCYQSRSVATVSPGDGLWYQSVATTSLSVLSRTLKGKKELLSDHPPYLQDLYFTFL